jgi:hypothetical protein
MLDQGLPPVLDALDADGELLPGSPLAPAHADRSDAREAATMPRS